MKRYCLYILTLLTTLLFSPQTYASMNTEKSKPRQINDEQIIIIPSPSVSPLEIITSPKTPRQPVPASDGSDYLKTLAGFSQIRNGGTNGAPVFRGMFGSRLRILTDRGEMLGACPSRMDAPSSYISPESYDLLSIIKGPQTVLWGPGNSAGTVRFEREPPHFSQAGAQGTASLLTASNKRADVNADLSLGNESGYLRLIGNKSRANDYKDGHGLRVPSRWDKWNGDLALGWTPTSDTLFEFTAGSGDGKARYAGRGMDGAQFKRESVGLRVEQSNIGGIFDKLEASIYHNHADHVMDNYSLRPLPSSQTMNTPLAKPSAHSATMPLMQVMPIMSMPMPMSMRLDRTTYGGRVAASWQASGVNVESGIDTQNSVHRSRKPAGWQQDARYQDIGIFSELTWNASANNKLVSGARLDHASVKNSASRGARDRQHVLPAAFLRLEHNVENLPLMLYAGLGFTERFPDYWELFSPSFGADGHSSAFDTLRTEKTTQLDFGAIFSRAPNFNEKEADKNFTGWISAYLGQVQDFILFDYDAKNPRLSRAENIDALIAGAEAGLSYLLSEALSADISLAYAWGENKSTTRPLPQMPPFETRVGLTWKHKQWSTSGLLRMVNSQKRVAINQGNVVGKDFEKSAAFYVVSVNAAYQVNKQTQLSVGIDNLFDRAYSEHLNLAGNSAFGYSAFTPLNEPGRTGWAKLNVSF